MQQKLLVDDKIKRLKIILLYATAQINNDECGIGRSWLKLEKIGLNITPPPKDTHTHFKISFLSILD